MWDAFLWDELLWDDFVLEELLCGGFVRGMNLCTGFFFCGGWFVVGDDCLGVMNVCGG